MFLSKLSFRYGICYTKSCFSTCSTLLSAKYDIHENVYPPVVRTSEISPVNHTKAHVGMWYTIAPEKRIQLFNPGLTMRYETMCEIFEECALMIREPVVRAIDYIKKSNLDMPPNKFFFYGGRGIGKTLCLAHLVHFFSDDGWMVVHLAQPNMWGLNPREILPSLTKPGYYDHTIDGSAWLRHFRQQNGPLLEKLQLLTKENFVWTQRESTEAGTPLLTFIDHGISRARYSSDCIEFLMKHLKQYANDGECKVALVAEGINSFFTPSSKRMREDRSFIELDKFTLFNAFRPLFVNDWKNGCIVGTIDERCGTWDRRETNLPRYLLRSKGWEALDPFVPIRLDKYTDVEFDSVLSYYNDRKFILMEQSHSEMAKDEIEHNSGKNPLMVYKLVQTR